MAIAAGLSDRECGGGPLNVRRIRIDRGVAVVALILALTGTAVAGYLAVENLRGETGVCVGVHGCATVQDSRYGELLGVPVSVPGFLLYAALAVAAAALLFARIASRVEIAFLGFLGTVAGVLMSAYLTYVEAFVLDAWCSYCIVSALLMSALFVSWGLLLFLSMRGDEAAEGPRTKPAASRGASSSRARS